MTTYAFPWSPSFSLLDRSALRTFGMFTVENPERVLTRCPIYRRLNTAQRLELLLRAPKGILNFRNYAWSLLYKSLEAYVQFRPGGVSPVTALALLLPEPRIERRFGALTDLVIIPEPIPQPNKERGSARRRATPFWAVIVWALKRYAAMSWKDVRELSTDLKRGSTSLRQTIRTTVEEPLAAFYGQLTGESLPPDAYQAAIQDRPDSPSWARDRMRELKRSARAARANPIK